MITLKIYNKENKDEVRGGEEEGVLENKWMIFHGLMFFLLSLFPKLDFLCISIYHLLFAPNSLPLLQQLQQGFQLVYLYAKIHSFEIWWHVLKRQVMSQQRLPFGDVVVFYQENLYSI
jgi:hypothetical protein